MSLKRFVLTFSSELTEKPLICHLIKDFDLEINILKAKIIPGEAGELVIEVSRGSEANIQAGIDYLVEEGVQVEPTCQDIILNATDCIHCGICTAVCRSHALTITPPDWKLNYDKEQCLICGLCAKACPMKNIKVSSGN